MQIPESDVLTRNVVPLSPEQHLDQSSSFVIKNGFPQVLGAKESLSAVSAQSLF